ncbi:MAG: transposase InsO family protein [Akkermansiaceae bacterium]
MPSFVRPVVERTLNKIGGVLGAQVTGHPNQINQWRYQFLEGATVVFGDASKAELAPVIDVKTPHARIGELTRARHGRPEIFNTDQGSQFTSTEFIKVLAAHAIKVSMDGKGAWRDNVFAERLWRTIKYEQVYRHACASVSEARAPIKRSLGFYNTRRPHLRIPKHRAGHSDNIRPPSISRCQTR